MFLYFLVSIVIRIIVKIIVMITYTWWRDSSPPNHVRMFSNHIHWIPLTSHQRMYTQVFRHASFSVESATEVLLSLSTSIPYKPEPQDAFMDGSRVQGTGVMVGGRGGEEAVGEGVGVGNGEWKNW